MSADQDFSHLPVDEKIAHSVWKVRLDGYSALVAQFENSRNTADPCFQIITLRPDVLRTIATDSNVVAQETGLQAVCKFLEFGCSPGPTFTKVKAVPLIPALCEKGLSSSRAGTKAKAIEALLLLVEILGSADWVFEQIVPYFENRLPKLVAGCVAASTHIISIFGAVVASPKPLIPCLAKLFAHSDRNVRAETTKLTVELYKWMGDALTQILFADLKPVQQRDLTAEFEKVKGEKPEQKRLTRAQQEAAAAQQADLAPDALDVVMEEASAQNVAPQLDMFDLMDPIDVLSKLPADLATRMSSSLWKDRKEALDEVIAVLSKAPKLANDDYSDLVRIFAKCMKDANIQVVQLAANGVEYLSKGLQTGFHKYQLLVHGPMVERSKEKKPAVADALANALDSIFSHSSLLDVLDDILNGMRHKTPQVKISAANYLQRCLALTPTPPRTAQIDAIMEVGVKLLGDSQEPIRQASTEMIGTLMKITGERELKSLLEKVDENRLSKVRAVYEKAIVKASSANGSQIKPTALRDKNTSSLPPAPALKKNAFSSVPSKRSATSPAKRPEASTKQPVKNFTGRLLILPVARAKPEEASITLVVHEERMGPLRAEIQKLKTDLEGERMAHSAVNMQLHESKLQNKDLLERLEMALKDSTNSTLMLGQKDTQIARLSSDLDNAKLKIKSLEQTIEMMKLQHSTSQVAPLPSFTKDGDSISPFRSPDRFGPIRLSLSELSLRVNRLSIEGRSGLMSPEGDGLHNHRPQISQPGTERTFTSFEPKASLASDEENWRKAAEVTAQLKARIEKMKQRNRLSSR